MSEIFGILNEINKKHKKEPWYHIKAYKSRFLKKWKIKTIQHEFDRDDVCILCKELKEEVKKNE